MEKNVGGWDRKIRIALGLVYTGAMMLVVAFGETFGSRTQVTLIAVILLLLAFLFLGTAGAEKCPVNRALDRNTYDGSDEENASPKD